MIQKLTIAALTATFALGLAACDNKGPAEQMGEEVDEAVDSVREGGESTANQVDDAIDEAREGVNEAADEIKTE